MSQDKRGKFLIDRTVQLGVVRTMLLQWCVFLFAAAICLPLIRAIALGDFSTPLLERATSAAVDAAILLGVFVILLPYFIIDIFKTTNRFAGPMYRLRSKIQALAGGTPFRPLSFRKGDWWADVAGDFNQMVMRLQSGSAIEGQDHMQPQEPAAV